MSTRYRVNAKWPPCVGWPFCLEGVRRCPTLPQGPPCSTIGAVRLSFRVRNVTGRFPHAMAAETLLMFQSNLKTHVVPLGFSTVHREPLSGRGQSGKYSN